MYSSPNAVGPIALLESYVVEYVDDYVNDNFDNEYDFIDPEDDELVDKIYNQVVEKINIKYLHKVVYWRLEELADEREKELYHNLMNGETITYKSDHKLYANITNNHKTKIDVIYKLPNKDCDLLVLIINAMNIKSNEEPSIEIERTKDNEVFNVYVNNTKFFVQLISDKQEFTYDVSLFQ